MHTKKNCRSDIVLHIQTSHVTDINILYNIACERRISKETFKCQVKHELRSYNVLELEMMIEYYRRTTGMSYAFIKRKDEIINILILYIFDSLNVQLLDNLHAHSLTRVVATGQRPAENIIRGINAIEEVAHNRTVTPAQNTIQVINAIEVAAQIRAAEAVRIEEVQNENPNNQTVQRQPLPRQESNIIPLMPTNRTEQQGTSTSNTIRPVQESLPSTSTEEWFSAFRVEEPVNSPRPVVPLRTRQTPAIPVIPTPNVRYIHNSGVTMANLRAINMPPDLRTPPSRPVNIPPARNTPPVPPPARSSTHATYKVFKFDEKCNEEDCPICYEKMEDESFVKLNCSHQFCKTCIKGCISRGQFNCPMCRTKISEVYTQTPVVRLSI